jgi:hypothetical protein
MVQTYWAKAWPSALDAKHNYTLVRGGDFIGVDNKRSKHEHIVA